MLLKPRTFQSTSIDRSARAFLTLLIFACAVGTAAAQIAPNGPPTGVQGELADPQHLVYAVAVEDPTLNGGLSIPTAEVGLMWNSQANYAAEVLDVHWGVLGVIIPTNKPASIGYRVRAIYSDSPAEAFDDFGPYFRTPAPLDRALEPKPHSHQFMHMNRGALFRPMGGNPYDITAWTTQGLTPTGPFPTQVVNLIGPAPKPMFKPIAKLAQLPPSSPTGGTITGLVMVLQTSVLETNAAMPTAPALNITNAIGLRVMVGPPIKLDSMSGNHGPNLGSIVFTGRNILPSLTVDFDGTTGNTITQPIEIIDGSTFAVAIPADAETGVLEMSAPTGDVGFEREPIFVATHGHRQDLVLPGQLPLITERIVDGESVYGFTVTGTADQLGGLFSLIPPAVLQSFDIELEIYPYNPSRNLAGEGSNVPIQITVEEVDSNTPPMGGPFVAQTSALLQTIGVSGVVLKATFEAVSGDVDITFTTSTPSSFEYMAVVRIRANVP